MISPSLPSSASTSTMCLPGVENDAPLPVHPGLTGLLPSGLLRRGSTVTVAGVTSLALALLAGPTSTGAWCAVVGLPDVGLLAASDLGVDLARLVLVPAPGAEWARVVAVLAEACAVVLARSPGRLPADQARRLTARIRRHDSLLVVLGPWEGADVHLTVTQTRWEGLEAGHGYLRARRVTVSVGGRRAAARTRRLRLWLPAAGGGIAPDDPGSAITAPGATPRLPPEPDRAAGGMRTLFAMASADELTRPMTSR